MILRKDKKRAGRELERLIAITKASHAALQGQIDQGRKAFRERIVAEFLQLWMQQPPEHLRMRENVDEAACKADLKYEAGLLFDNAVELGDPHHTVVYKDIAIEDLKDSERMDELQKFMRGARVSEATLAKLFEVVDAAPVKK